MNTRQYHYLVTISHSKNLSAAAKTLNISQPALSKFLSKCEKTFGFPIFIRSHRELIPTTIGQYIIQCAYKILDEKNRMLLTMNKVSGNNKNRIRLATAPNRAAIIYSKIYHEFSRRFPDTSLELVELLARDQPMAVYSGQVDLALGSGEMSDMVVDIPIAHEELLVSIPISHPLSQEPEIEIQQLIDTPFVLQSKRHSIRVIADKLFETAGFDPLVAFESDDVLLIDSMLNQSVGVGLVSQSHVTPRDDISYIPLSPPVYQQLHIRYPIGHILTPSEKYLANLLIKERLGDPRYTAIESPELDSILTEQNLYRSSDSDDATSIGIGKEASYSFSHIYLDTEILSYLVAIIDEKSLSAAAERLYIEQSALSRHLKNIEDTIGLTLFSRIHNQLQPSNAGKILANHTRNMLHIESEMFEHLSSYKSGYTGKYQIYVDSSIYELICANLQTTLSIKYPDLEIILIGAHRDFIYESLLNASTEIGVFFTTDSSHPQLNYDLIIESRFAYFSTGEDLTYSAKSSEKLKFIVAPHHTSLRSDQEKIISADFTTNPHIICEASIPIMNTLLGKTDAITILPLCLIESEMKSCNHSILETHQKYKLTIATRAGKKLPKVSESIINELNQHLKVYFSNNNY
ncbi:DNA-binding transcriptional regulator, LysR family [Proteiniclasticum ruminis]|uniref:DNA-binding transcriptional regulator, LysR family n=2 Tax=Proteiniclasticum ruminis TaxID=398199 RepID=A0A1G8HNT6_9CLOT|nr:DNA-binding transcriptional regulator, LysR family [Proteiniclasticum ruminis]